jgi:hypothetical protein
MAGNKGQREDVELQGRIKLFDPDGSLSEDCREIWTLIAPEQDAIAREFWVEYGRAPELKSPLSETKIREMSQRIGPYLKCATAICTIANGSIASSMLRRRPPRACR